jgi:squalene-hopene/tetraprenyl-beta-curcumene cyclase
MIILLPMLLTLLLLTAVRVHRRLPAASPVAAGFGCRLRVIAATPFLNRAAGSDSLTRCGDADAGETLGRPDRAGSRGSRSMDDATLVDELQDPTTRPSARCPGDTLEAARVALDRGVEHLLSLQNPEGYWCAELEGDSILQSEYLLMKWMLGHEKNDPRLPKIAAYLRRQQREDGAWGQYPGSKMDISATVKGYFCLKLMGDPIDAPHMRKAREQVLAAGGAEKINSFSKFYLAALGQLDYAALPSIPPEIVYLPKWFYFHLDKVSAWTRTMIIPLSIVTTFRPVRTLPRHLHIDELFVDPRKKRKLIATQDRPHPVWSPMFLGIDRCLKLLGRLGQTRLRRRALQWMEKWLLEHLEKSDGLGAIFPPMVYIQVAFRCLGYPDDHPVLVKARKDLDDLMIHDEQTDETRIQPCFSPVWDTGIAAYALTEAGLDQGHEAMRRCRQWLLSKECREPADWMNNIKGPVEPSGWFFEFNNFFYPDADDTAMVAMTLQRIGGDEALAAAARGVAWNFALQNDDGGWAAFDRGAQGRDLLEYVPFADHNAIQDPSCPDITGRVFECLGNHGFKPDHPAIRKGIDYIRSRQEPDGAFFGRWGVNYIYGTYQVLVGLEKVQCDMSEEWVRKAGQWLKSVQKDDGSFGESPDSYEDPTLRGRGPSTASQTAWGAMGMMAVFGADDPAVETAIAWLADTQLDTPSGAGGGGWDEPWFTGTGFPRVFYLRYHLYKTYFPIMAIARFLRRRQV